MIRLSVYNTAFSILWFEMQITQYLVHQNVLYEIISLQTNTCDFDTAILTYIIKKNQMSL